MSLKTSSPNRSCLQVGSFKSDPLVVRSVKDKTVEIFLDKTGFLFGILTGPHQFDSKRRVEILPRHPVLSFQLEDVKKILSSEKSFLLFKNQNVIEIQPKLLGGGEGKSELKKISSRIMALDEEIEKARKISLKFQLRNLKQADLLAAFRDVNSLIKSVYELCQLGGDLYVAHYVSRVLHKAVDFLWLGIWSREEEQIIGLGACFKSEKDSLIKKLKEAEEVLKNKGGIGIQAAWFLFAAQVGIYMLPEQDKDWNIINSIFRCVYKTFKRTALSSIQESIKWPATVGEPIDLIRKFCKEINLASQTWYPSLILARYVSMGGFIDNPIQEWSDCFVEDQSLVALFDSYGEQNFLEAIENEFMVKMETLFEIALYSTQEKTRLAALSKIEKLCEKTNFQTRLREILRIGANDIKDLVQLSMPQQHFDLTKKRAQIMAVEVLTQLCSLSEDEEIKKNAECLLDKSFTKFKEEGFDGDKDFFGYNSYKTRLFVYYRKGFTSFKDPVLPSSYIERKNLSSRLEEDLKGKKYVHWFEKINAADVGVDFIAGSFFSESTNKGYLSVRLTGKNFNNELSELKNNRISGKRAKETEPYFIILEGFPDDYPRGWKKSLDPITSISGSKILAVSQKACNEDFFSIYKSNKENFHASQTRIWKEFEGKKKLVLCGLPIIDKSALLTNFLLENKNHYQLSLQIEPSSFESIIGGFLVKNGLISEDVKDGQEILEQFFKYCENLKSYLLILNGFSSSWPYFSLIPSSEKGTIVFISNDSINGFLNEGFSPFSREISDGLLEFEICDGLPRLELGDVCLDNFIKENFGSLKGRLDLFGYDYSLLKLIYQCPPTFLSYFSNSDSLTPSGESDSLTPSGEVVFVPTLLEGLLSNNFICKDLEGHFVGENLQKLLKEVLSDELELEQDDWLKLKKILETYSNKFVQFLKSNNDFASWQSFLREGQGYLGDSLTGLFELNHSTHAPSLHLDPQADTTPTQEAQ